MSQANADNPDLLVSLYDGPGCIGTMRGRTSLGITTPVLAPNSCAATEVIDQVGDEALGWIFLGAQTNEPSAANDLIAEIMSPVLDVPADEVDPSALGLGGLGIVQAMTLAQFSDAIVSEGGEITGESLYAYMGSTNESIWPSGLPFECGRATGLSVHLHLRVPRHRIHRGRHPARGRRSRDGFGLRVPPVSVRRRR